MREVLWRASRERVAEIAANIESLQQTVIVPNVVHGRPVTDIDALANPGALELFRGLPGM